MKPRKLIKFFTIGILLTCSYLWAQPRQVDIKRENSEFLELQTTEANQEKNIKSTYDDFSKLGWLVDMVKKDRKLQQEQATEKGRLDFNKSFRYVKFTPRNTYVRYIKEGEDFLFTEFGTVKEVKELIAKRIEIAKAVGVATKDINLQTREGIELTQFNFIYGHSKEQRVAVGSKRKSVSLFFTPKAGAKPGSEDNWDLSLIVSKVVKDNFRTGVRNVELVIDTSPADDPMDDVIILHRYNEKPVSAIVLGSMSNTPTHPHRVKFKQKFYLKLVDHFYRLYSLVATYASKDDNENNEKVINTLKAELDY